MNNTSDDSNVRRRNVSSTEAMNKENDPSKSSNNFYNTNTQSQSNSTAKTSSASAGSSTSSSTAIVPAKTSSGEDIIYQESYRPWFFPILFIVPPVAPWFYNYSVVMTKSYVEFGYTLNLRKRVYYKDILAFQILEDVNGLTQFGGYGLRMNFSGQIAYMVQDGPCIKLTLKSKPGSPYVFSVKNPNKVARELRSYGAAEVY